MPSLGSNPCLKQKMWNIEGNGPVWTNADTGMNEGIEHDVEPRKLDVTETNTGIMAMASRALGNNKIIID